jgi:hypothetical protein
MGAYDDLNDEQLYDLAKTALLAAAREKPYSIERAVKFAAYDSIVNEAKRRAVKQVSERLGLPDLDL